MCNSGTGAPVKGQRHFNRNAHVNSSGNNSPSFLPLDCISPSCGTYSSQSATGRQVPGRKLGSPDTDVGSSLPWVSVTESQRWGWLFPTMQQCFSICLQCLRKRGLEGIYAGKKLSCLQALQHHLPSEIQNSHQTQSLHLAIFWDRIEKTLHYASTTPSFPHSSEERKTAAIHN